jgi:hypothetical protein
MSKVQAEIESLLYNHHDDVDGWRLNDGTIVHFPPHIGDQLCEWISEGDEVYVEGTVRNNRIGQRVIFPTYIESKGWSLTWDDQAAEPPPPRPPRGPHVQEEDPGHERVTNEDLLQELRKIRRLIEDRMQ